MRKGRSPKFRDYLEAISLPSFGRTFARKYGDVIADFTTVIGSFRRGDNTEQSDIDILVVFQPDKKTGVAELRDEAEFQKI